MNKKKEDLKAIADLLHKWCVMYGEPYATACAFNESNSNFISASISPTQPDYWEMSVYEKYETPAAGTPRESKV